MNNNHTLLFIFDNIDINFLIAISKKTPGHARGELQGFKNWLANNITNNPATLDALFANEKCRNIAEEVIAVTFHSFIYLHKNVAVDRGNSQYSQDVRSEVLFDLFIDNKEWYNEHGIQWLDENLLEYPADRICESEVAK